MSISSICWFVGKNQPSSLGCIFCKKEYFFRPCRFSLFSAEPLYQHVRTDHRIIFTVWSNSENHCKTHIESWFVLVSLIFHFSVYFAYLSRITFGGGGPLPGPQGAPLILHCGPKYILLLYINRICSFVLDSGRRCD